ncbi:MAG TPA: hypothetical protein VHA52_05700 [Candidatus Babeliaceae bacterium]|nr:hypothetical protein [Candidatus Babeliaceae bacterium]
MILLVLGLTLPFHCVLDTFHIFPKDNLTMKNTFITLSEIDSMVSRYNKASLSEKEDIKKEPLFKKLMEEGLIGEVQDSTKNHH